jgi:YD repeat-containing protein
MKSILKAYIKNSLFTVILVCCLICGVNLTVIAQNVQYTYDSLNQLAEVRYPDKVIHYTYDAAGNRTAVTVEVLAAAPAISSLNPRGAVAAGGGFTLKINGSNFTNASVVQWNGTNRPATFVSTNELRINISQSDIATVSRASVVVLNSTPSLIASNAQTFSVVQTAAFSGRVTSGGNGLSNISLALSGTESDTATTDANGDFNFAVLSTGSYTITPVRTNYSFTPANRTVNYSGITETNLDFTGSLVSYAISGRIATFNGTGLSGVNIALSGSQTGQTTTDNSGNYSFNCTAEGNYTITPILNPYAFSPANRSFTNLSLTQTANFIALLPTAANAGISGRVTTASGRAIGNATLVIEGGNLSERKFARTNAFGYYRFKDLEVGQTYIISVASKRYSFANPTRVITLNEDLTGEDFVSDGK